jgi:CHAD domain-containing protein
MQTPAELHRLRIAVKKLRYATEFFSDLFQVKAMAVQRARLAQLQDILGFINDAVSVEPLLAVAQANAHEWPAAAAEAVLVWHRERAESQRDRLASAWRRFRKAPRPWL